MTAVHSDKNHVGTNIFRGVTVDAFGGHAYYLRPAEQGQNVLIGCRGANCGRSNLRLGARDAVLNFESEWTDETRENIGVNFECDDPGNTTVENFHAKRIVPGNDCIRVRGKPGNISFRDLMIENYTSNPSISVRGEGGVGSVVFENVVIEDHGDGSIAAAAVEVDRHGVVLRDALIGTTQSERPHRVGVHVEGSGGVRLVDSNLDQRGNESLRIGERGGEDIGVISLDHCRLARPIHFYGTSNEPRKVEIIHSDLREIDSLWNAETPDNLVFLDNEGFPGSRIKTVE